MEATLNNILIRVIQGDLTSQVADAIVHSANPELEMETSGLGQAILAAGGASIQAEARAIGACEYGYAVITGGGNLPARHVIHAVGPQMGIGNERGKLGSAVWNTLKLAEQKHLTSIAMPAIATGRSGGFPMEACARIMAQKVVDFTFEDVQHLKTIIFCLYTPEAFDTFEDAVSREVDDALLES